MLAGGLAAAASIALLAAWQYAQPAFSPRLRRGVGHHAGRRRPAYATPRRSRGLKGADACPNPSAKSVATFTAGGGGIAIPVASESPEVTIVQFYSTTEADRRMQRQRELEAKYRELIGG